MHQWYNGGCASSSCTFSYIYVLTCNLAPGTSACLDQQLESGAAEILRNAPAVHRHPGWHGHRAEPELQGTVGRRYPRGSLRSRCVGIGANSRCRHDAGRRISEGSGRVVDSWGRAGTRPGAPAAAPDWRRTRTVHPLSHCSHTLHLPRHLPLHLLPLSQDLLHPYRPLIQHHCEPGPERKDKMTEASNESYDFFSV